MSISDAFLYNRFITQYFYNIDKFLLCVIDLQRQRFFAAMHSCTVLSVNVSKENPVNHPNFSPQIGSLSHFYMLAASHGLPADEQTGAAKTHPGAAASTLNTGAAGKSDLT